MRLSRLLWPYHMRGGYFNEDAESVLLDLIVPVGLLVVVAHLGSLVLFTGGKWESMVYPFTAGSLILLLCARIWVMDNLFAEKGRHGLRLPNPNMAQFGGTFLPAVVWGSVVIILAWFL